MRNQEWQDSSRSSSPHVYSSQQVDKIQAIPDEKEIAYTILCHSGWLAHRVRQAICVQADGSLSVIDDALISSALMELVSKSSRPAALDDGGSIL